MTDAEGNVTRNVYTETNGLTTQVKATNPLGHATTTQYAPAWGNPVGQTDPNGLKSKMEYDALGRLAKVWLPDRTSVEGASPSIKYEYLMRTDKPVAIKTEKRQSDGSYSVEYKLHDGHLRPRQVQSQGPAEQPQRRRHLLHGNGQRGEDVRHLHRAGRAERRDLPRRQRRRGRPDPLRLRRRRPGQGPDLRRRR
nr:hypothetical protein GCM10020092_036850 [Actinoplanes digitatis]